MSKTLARIAKAGRSWLYLVVFLSFAFFVRYVHAARPILDIEDPEELVDEVLCPIAGVMFGILIVVTIIVVIWAAFTYLTAGGDTEKVRTANKMLLYAAIAVLVGLVAKGFPHVVGSFVGASSFDGC